LRFSAWFDAFALEALDDHPAPGGYSHLRDQSGLWSVSVNGIGLPAAYPYAGAANLGGDLGTAFGRSSLKTGGQPPASGGFLPRCKTAAELKNTAREEPTCPVPFGSGEEARSLTAVLALSSAVGAQLASPTNNLPNPYQAFPEYVKMPTAGAGVRLRASISRRTLSVWAIDRCGKNTCVGSDLDPILKFDASGKLRKKLQQGHVRVSHGSCRQGRERLGHRYGSGDGRGQGARSARRCKLDKTKLLMTLGTPA
jgi:hypothetical protein